MKRTIATQLGALLLILLSGCAVVQDQMSPTEMYVERENIRITMPASNPAGKYILETSSGERLAETEFTPYGNSRQPFAKNAFWLRTDPRRLSADSAGSCMRIRKPDDSFLAVRSGIVGSSTTFKIPVLEYIVLNNYAIPSLQRDIGRINGDRQAKTQVEQQLHVHAAFSEGRCRVPDAGPRPANVCRSRNEARTMFTEYCVNSNFSCGVAGGKLASYLSQGTPTTTDDFDEAVSLFIQGSCSVAVDRAYSQSTSWWSLLRSAFVSVVTNSMVEELIGRRPVGDEQLVVDALAGVANTYLCVEEAYYSCSQNWNRWMGRYTQAYNQCRQIERSYNDINRRLQLNEGKLVSMEEKLEALQKRQQEILGKKWGVRLNQRVEACE